MGAAANLGLIFYMFLVGLELDFGRSRAGCRRRSRSRTPACCSDGAGLLVALPIYDLVAPDTNFIAFALFMGVAMSITAFPVLARILVERRMLKRPLGTIALAAAAIDDVTAWFLSRSRPRSRRRARRRGSSRVALTVAFCLVMGFLARPLLARVSVAYDEAGRVPVAWITAIFVGVLLSA